MHIMTTTWKDHRVCRFKSSLEKMIFYANLCVDKT